MEISPSDSGKIQFQRTDKGNAFLDLDVKNIQSLYSSSLVSKDLRVRTIEHLMAALFVLEINSALIKTDGEEVPIFDGSAKTFFEKILQAGSKTLELKNKSISIKKPFQIKEKDSNLSVSPNPSLKITYVIDYDHPCIGRQELSLDINQNTFKKEIAPARTFGFLKDAEMLRKKKLALGSSLKNTIVLDEKKVINGPLRFKDEFVRHKILDLIGDLSLLNGKLCGHFRAEKAGHRLHIKTVRFLLENRGCLDID